MYGDASGVAGAGASGGGALSGAASGAMAGAAFGPIGAIGGAIIGAAGSYFSGKSSADFAERSYKHRYRWMVNDLQKAGLNPMLAVHNGAGSVNQPQYPNVGEGALKGASAVQAMRVANAQMENIGADTALKVSSAKAQDAQANKLNTESSILGSYGSAEAAARIDDLTSRAAESFVRAAQIVQQTGASVEKLEHDRLHWPIIRDLDKALADAKRAEIPMREFVGQIAEAAGRALQNLSKVDGESLLRDTGNLIEDKIGNAGGSLWRAATAPYRFIDGAWRKFKDYASSTRQEAVR